MAYPTDPDKAAKLKRAVQLRDQGVSFRDIAAEVNTAHSTVVRWLEEARIADEHASLYQLAEERIRKLMRLEIFTDWLIDEYEMGAKKGPAATYVPLLMQVERERARLMGSDTSTKLDVNVDGKVDARAVWEAVREARRNLEEEPGV